MNKKTVLDNLDFSDFSEMDISRNFEYYKKLEKWSKGKFCPESDAIFYPFGGIDVFFPLHMFADSEISSLFILSQENTYPDEAVNYTKYTNDFFEFFHNSTFFKHGWATTSQDSVEGENEKSLDCIKYMGMGNILLMILTMFKAEILHVSEYQNFENSISITIKYNNWFKKVNYISCELSNGGIASQYLLNLIKRLSSGITFMKAAHFNLYDKKFSFLRDFIVDNSEMIVQDHTGIHLLDLHRSCSNPFRELKLYGSSDYIHPCHYGSSSEKDDKLNSFIELFNLLVKVNDTLPFRVSYEGANCLIIRQ